MGLSSSTTKSKATYEPQVLGAQQNSLDAYNANKGNVADTSNTMRSLGTGLINSFYQGDPLVKAGSGYATDVLSGRYLTGNPHLQAMIDQTGNDVANGVNAHLGTRGRTGGDIQTSLLARELSKNETGLRFADYNAERDRMQNAAGLVPSLAEAQYAALRPGVAALMGGTTLPTEEADKYAATVQGLLGQYGTTKTSLPVGSLLAQIGGNIASAWAGGGFK